MSDMKCPFCQQELQETYDGKQFWCSNYKDPTHPINMLGTKELWQELIRTRKALEKAKVVLANLRDYAELDGMQECDVYEALEQKDK